MATPAGTPLTSLGFPHALTVTKLPAAALRAAGRSQGQARPAIRDADSAALNGRQVEFGDPTAGVDDPPSRSPAELAAQLAALRPAARQYPSLEARLTGIWRAASGQALRSALPWVPRTLGHAHRAEALPGDTTGRSPLTYPLAYPPAGPTGCRPAPADDGPAGGLGDPGGAAVGVAHPVCGGDAAVPVGWDGLDDPPAEPEDGVPAGWLRPAGSVCRAVSDLQRPAVEPDQTGDGGETADPTRLADGTLRGLIGVVTGLLEQVRTAAWTAPVGGGELAALSELLDAVDTGQAAVFGLTTRIQTGRLAPRAVGCSLDDWLAASSVLTGAQQRLLIRQSSSLRQLPHLAGCVAKGQVPAAVVAAVTGASRRLRAVDRDQLDRLFAPGSDTTGHTPDQLADAANETADRLDRRRAAQDEARRIHLRFLALRGLDDGSLAGYFELDPEAAAVINAALDAAMSPPPSGPDDVTGHAADLPGGPKVPQRWSRQALGRQRADALQRIAEDYLAARHPNPHTSQPHPDCGCPPHQPPTTTGHNDTSPQDHTCQTPRIRRARPRLLVWTDIRHLLGDHDQPRAARLLWQTHAGPLRLTPAAATRLASDADLRFILHDNGVILGATQPIPTITPALRDAIHARDHHCRFPGCTQPVQYCDLHHVKARSHGGPTLPDNLVTLCVRHHRAVTNGAWRLTMTPDGTVTVRRGQRRITSHPPQHRNLRPQPP